jgi:hypothetical protein
VKDHKQFHEFRADLIARHQHYLTGRIATLADLTMLCGLALVLVRRFRATGADVGIGARACERGASFSTGDARVREPGNPASSGLGGPSRSSPGATIPQTQF